MSSKVHFRLYEPSDFLGLMALFSSVYGADAERKTSAWKYLDQPLRRSVISVAVADGRIVGTQPSYEVLLRIGDERVSGAVLLDVMTHPDYRGRGIFGGVVEHLRRECHARGMAILLTTPNVRAAQGFRKIPAWHCLGELAPLVRPVRLSQLLIPWRRTTISNGSVLASPSEKGGQQSGNGEDSQVVSVNHLNWSIEELWRAFAEVAFAMIVRDTTYVGWRFSNCGNRRYRLFVDRAGWGCRGFASVSNGNLLGKHIVFLTELMAHPSDKRTACRLLSAVVAHARSTGACAVVAYHVPGSATERLLRRCGFWRVVRPLRLRPYTIWAATNLDQHRAAKILDLASWHMSMADSDLA
jgi:GNAT superfamily N-acetyltransferase